MPKYIDVDSLKTILEERRDTAKRLYGDLGGAVNGCIKLLDQQPAADVEPKRGTGWWIPGDYVATEHGECVTYPGEGITCSCCHYGFKARFLWSRDYCPHCGSRMLPEPPKETDGDEQTAEDI